MTRTFTLRLAAAEDIPAIQLIRNSVRENRLSDPSRVPDEACLPFIDDAALWVAEDHGELLGFSACDVGLGTIWALFIAPEAEGQGIGRALLDLALRRLREAGHKMAKLSTEPDTRAADFYARNGWREIGHTWDGEVMFERAL